MATRVYLPTSGTPPITPAIGSGWAASATSGFIRLKAVTTKIASALLNHTSASPSAIDPSMTVHRQYILGPLAAQTISGTLTGVMRGLESNANLNATLAIGVRRVDATGAHMSDVLSVSASDNTAAAPPEFGTAAATRRYQDAAEATTLTLTSTTLNSGDFLVIEIGWRKASTSTSFAVTYRFGDAAATDFAHTDGLTTDLNPWVEFSGTIAAYVPTFRDLTGATNGTATASASIIRVTYRNLASVASAGRATTMGLVSRVRRLAAAVAVGMASVSGTISKLVPTAGIGWSGAQFVASGGTPVLWGAAAFQTSGGYPPVQWEDGVFST